MIDSSQKSLSAVRVELHLVFPLHVLWIIFTWLWYSLSESHLRIRPILLFSDYLIPVFFQLVSNFEGSVINTRLLLSIFEGIFWESSWLIFWVDIRLRVLSLVLVQAWGKAWGLCYSKVCRGKVTSLRAYLELRVSHRCLAHFGLKSFILFDLEKPILDVLDVWLRLLIKIVVVNTFLFVFWIHIVRWLHGYALLFNLCLNRFLIWLHEQFFKEIHLARPSRLFIYPV